MPIPFQKDTPLKNRVTVEPKILLQHRPGKELAAKVQKVVALASLVQVKTKMTKREPKTPKTTSSDPSSRRVNTKKKKEPFLDPSMETEEEGSFEDVEEVEMVNSNKESESEEEEAELENPLLEKTKIKTWTSELKKFTFAFKTLGSSKRLVKGKMPKRGNSS